MLHFVDFMWSLLYLPKYDNCNHFLFYKPRIVQDDLVDKYILICKKWYISRRIWDMFYIILFFITGETDDRSGRQAEQKNNNCSLLTIHFPTFVLLSTLSSILVYLPRWNRADSSKREKLWEIPHPGLSVMKKPLFWNPDRGRR